MQNLIMNSWKVSSPYYCFTIIFKSLITKAKRGTVNCEGQFYITLRGSIFILTTIHLGAALNAQ